MKRKLLIALLVLLCICLQSTFACIIFGVGRLATTDGSTMTSHTCDSTGDDLRLWLIPSMEKGSERDVVLSGRRDADYGNFPEVKDYGTRGIVMDTYVNDKDTYQYLHAMYSFANEKGLTMTESTCGTTRDQRAVFAKYEGIWDCYMLQDAALENCATAREAVEYMGARLNESGWSGSPETMTIGDGTDVWVFEAYGGKMWCAFRLPEDAVFVCPSLHFGSDLVDLHHSDVISAYDVEQDSLCSIDGGLKKRTLNSALDSVSCSGLAESVSHSHVSNASVCHD